MGDVTDDGTAHLFVYGTLRPGDVRWAMLEPWVDDDGVDDAVPGSLYDTGLGYPAATFSPGGVPVRGRTYRLRATDLASALALLDEEEDTVEGLYRRVVVTTASGVRAYAYEYGTGLELTPIDGGDWLAR